LVYSATGNSVDDVFVAGEQVVRDGHLTRLDEAEALNLVAESMQRIGRKLDVQKLVNLRWPVV
jgi:cytosine/adenosine deaminase-related metal-dependent hydrolase